MSDCPAPHLGRRKWGPEPPAAHPAPEVRCRLAEAHEVPRAASTFARTAVAAGWLVVTTYARGTRLGAHGGPLGGAIESICVRGRRGGEHFAATWIALQAGKYTTESALYLHAGKLERHGVRDLAERVKAPPPPGTPSAVHSGGAV